FGTVTYQYLERRREDRQREIAAEQARASAILDAAVTVADDSPLTAILLLLELKGQPQSAVLRNAASDLAGRPFPMRIVPVKGENVQFSPDGTRLVIGQPEGIQIRDAATLRPIRTLPTNDHQSVLSVWFGKGTNDLVVL